MLNWTHAACVCADNAKYNTYIHTDRPIDTVRVFALFIFVARFGRLINLRFVSRSLCCRFENGASRFETLLSYQPKPMERYSICKNLYISIRVYSSISSSFANHFFFAAELLCLALCISLTCGSRLLRLIENSCSILNLSLNERPFLKCRAHPHFIAVSIHFQQLLSIEICNRITHHYRTTISEIICFSFHLNIVSLEKCFFFLKKKTSKQNQ